MLHRPSSHNGSTRNARGKHRIWSNTIGPLNHTWPSLAHRGIYSGPFHGCGCCTYTEAAVLRPGDVFMRSTRACSKHTYTAWTSVRARYMTHGRPIWMSRIILFGLAWHMSSACVECIAARTRLTTSTMWMIPKLQGFYAIHACLSFLDSCPAPTPK